MSVKKPNRFDEKFEKIEQKQSVVSAVMTSEKKKKEVSNLVEVREQRTKQKSILLTPTLDKEATKKCKRLNISFNEVVNQLLELWVNE